MKKCNACNDKLPSWSIKTKYTLNSKLCCEQCCYFEVAKKILKDRLKEKKSKHKKRIHYEDKRFLKILHYKAHENTSKKTKTPVNPAIIE